MNKLQQILTDDSIVTEKYFDNLNKDLNFNLSQVLYNSVKLENKKTISKLLYQAMMSKNLLIYFMPQYELINRNIIGAEALCRWEVPEGIICPDKFINILEEYDLIYDLDFFVLDYCCMWIKDWITRGYKPISISVNQSRKNFSNPHYVENLSALITKYGIPAQLINLEITETALFENISETKNIIAQLQKIGFKISIDDFGKGYSSLHLLSEISADELKIDKGLLEKITDSNHSKIILKKIMEMAKEIGYQINCEGVETKEQEEFIKNSGCDYAQGYYFAHPMPVSNFETLVMLNTFNTTSYNNSNLNRKVTDKYESINRR